MKNLIVLFQKSILFFAVFLFSNCEREAEFSTPDSLSYESLKQQRLSENTILPILSTLNKSGFHDNFRYLTLFDASLKNVLVVKISTEDKELLNSLNEETVQLIVRDKFYPRDTTMQTSKAFKIELRDQSVPLIPLQIEVLESNFQKSVQLYGIKFTNTNALKSQTDISFTYKNSNVNAVHVVGRDAIRDISKFAVHTLDCPECEYVYLAPYFFEAKKIISFYHNKKSKLILNETSKLRDEILVLWQNE